MKREFDIQIQETRFNFLVDLFDRVVFDYNARALETLSKIALGENIHASELVNIIDKLNLRGQLREEAVTTNRFGHCNFGHGPAEEVNHRKGSPTVTMACRGCSAWTEEKPETLRRIEEMGYTWNQLHTSPQKQEERRKLAQQWSGGWGQMKGGQSDSTKTS